jgi:WD40 repeat protein
VEHLRLHTEPGALRTERARLRTELARFRMERARPRMERARFRTERARLRTELARLRTERARLLTESFRLHTERPRVHTEHGRLPTEHEKDRMARRETPMRRRSLGRTFFATLVGALAVTAVSAGELKSKPVDGLAGKLKLPEKILFRTAFSANGAVFGVLADRIWFCDTKTLKVTGSTPALEGEQYVIEASFSKDGKKCAFRTSAGPSVLVCEVPSGKQLAEIKDGGKCHALSPDGKLVVTGDDEKLVAYDAATGKEKARATTTSKVLHLTFAPDGKSIAGGGNRGVGASHRNMVLVYDASSLKATTELETKLQGAPRAQFLPDGSMAFDANGVHHNYDSHLGNPINVSGFEQKQGRDLFTGGTNAFSPDGSLLLCKVEGGKLGIFDTGSKGYKEQDLGAGRELRDIGFSPDSKLVLLATKVDEVVVVKTADLLR